MCVGGVEGAAELTSASSADAKRLSEPRPPKVPKDTYAALVASPEFMPLARRAR